jgi:hypothetical protein
MRTYL